MNTWNSLDFFILLIFAANTILGMARGATKEIVSMMCLSVALIFAIKFTVPLATFFNSSPLINDVVDNQITKNFMLAIGAGPVTASLLEQIFYSISMLICFGGAFSVCEAMLTFTGFNEVFSFPYAALNRKVGGSLGFIRGYIFNLILIAILAFHLLGKGNVINNNLVTGSFFVHVLGPGAAKLDSIISSQQPDSYRQILEQKPAYSVEDLYKTIRNTPETVPGIPTTPQQPQPQPNNPPSQPGFMQPQQPNNAQPNSAPPQSGFMQSQPQSNPAQ